MNNNKLLRIIQIAGFFPRRIVSSEKVPKEVMAGEYLGMIKFGSRVDLEFEGDISKIKIGQKIKLGDVIYHTLILNLFLIKININLYYIKCTIQMILLNASKRVLTKKEKMCMMMIITNIKKL